MRGTFFQKPLEIVLELKGESWFQGDVIQGTVSLKTSSEKSYELDGLGLYLIFGEPKKMLKKSPKAYEVLEQIDLDKHCVSDEMSVTEFSLKLPDCCPISEKSKGIFLVFGAKDDLFSAPRLELPIQPKKTILQFLEVFETFERFKSKGVKNKKGALEFKMLPPDSKDYAAVDSLLLLIKEEDQKLILDYLFKVKKLEYGEIGVESVASKLAFHDELSKSQYHSFGDSVNQEGIQAALKQILDQVKSKTTY